MRRQALKHAACYDVSFYWLSRAREAASLRTKYRAIYDCHVRLYAIGCLLLLIIIIIITIIITGPPNGPVLFCWLASVVVCRRL